MTHLTSLVAFATIALAAAHAEAEAKIPFVMVDSFGCKAVACVSGACKDTDFSKVRPMRARGFKTKNARFAGLSAGDVRPRTPEQKLAGKSDWLTIDLGDGGSHDGINASFNKYEMSLYAQGKLPRFSASYGEWHEFDEENDEDLTLECGNIR